MNTTNDFIAKYKKLKVKKHTIKLELTDTLDNSIYSTPIAIRRQLPSEWANVTVLQDNDIVRSNVVEIYSLKYVEFDVVPDAGMVKIQIAD